MSTTRRALARFARSSLERVRRVESSLSPSARTLVSSSASARSSDAPWWSASPSGQAATVVFSFATSGDRERWTTFGDFEHGGASTCELDVGDKEQVTTSEAEQSERFIAERFSTLRGVLSSEIPGERAERLGSKLRRSGFAGVRTKPLTPTLTVPDPTMDLDAYDALSYRVRGDGRQYIASVVTENWMTETTSEDAWLASFQPPPNEWDDIVIPIEAFTQTYRGRAILGEHSRMSANRVVRLGITVAGSGATDADERRKNDGPFELDIHSIVGLRMTDEEIDAHAERRKGDHTKYPLGGFALLAFELERPTEHSPDDGVF